MNFELTMNIQITNLANHWLGINLAHVMSIVLSLDISDMQIPLPWVEVGNTEPWIMDQDLCVNR